MDDDVDDQSGRWQIGQFAELVGLSIPQLRRYDRLRLLEPDGREAQSGYRYYTRGQTGAARVIALLRSMDMPIADIRRILAGTSDAERRQLFRDHRARLEGRLDEVRRSGQAARAASRFRLCRAAEQFAHLGCSVGFVYVAVEPWPAATPLAVVRGGAGIGAAGFDRGVEVRL